MELISKEEAKRRLEKEILPNPNHPLYSVVKPLADELYSIRNRSAYISLTPEGARRQTAYVAYLDGQIYNAIAGLPLTPFVDPTKTELPVSTDKKAASNPGSSDSDNLWAWAKWLASAAVVGGVVGVVVAQMKNRSARSNPKKKRGKKK